MAKEFKITSLRLADLEKELNYLKTTREREIAAMIAEARSYGDLSENSEYDAAKNEQAKLYGRIAEIEDILAHAVIIQDENEASGRVGLGCTVTVRDPRTGAETAYRITGSQEANPMERKISVIPCKTLSLFSFEAIYLLTCVTVIIGIISHALSDMRILPFLPHYHRKTAAVQRTHPQIGK